MKLKRVISMVCVVMLTSVLVFGGCSKIEVNNSDVTKNTASEVETPTTETPTTETPTTETPTTEEVTTETVTEETQPETEKLIEYTNNEDEIPKELIDAAQSCYNVEFGSYLYGDIDRDNEKELLAAYLDYSVGQWKIIKLETESLETEDFYSIVLNGSYEICQMALIDLKTETHIVVNLYSEMGIDCNSYILEIEESEVKEKLYFLATVFQAQNGDIVIQRTAYNSCLDTTTGMMMGRTWSYSYLTYDAESRQYKEYAAHEITEEEFLEYDGALEIEQKIIEEYGDKELKFSFYRRNNGIMYVQYEYTEGSIITYEYYTLYYEGNKILDRTEINQGVIDRSSTILECI